MPFALIIWAILILVITATSCPGFVTCVMVVFGVAGLIVWIVSGRQHKVEQKELNKIFDEFNED